VPELLHRSLWGLALAVLLMNLPFGFWRAGAKRFTRPWFVAVHAPVPFVILLRVISGLGWQLASFPVLVGAFFTGQLLGGAMRRRH
jgi:F0F1-type ATP synthase membrane subunit a